MFHNNVTCKTCNHDRSLQSLKKIVDGTAKLLKNTWRNRDFDVRVNHVMPGQALEDSNYVINQHGSCTVVPAYGAYVKTWKQALYANPLDINWELFDVHKKEDVDYLLSLIEILSDQMELWQTDIDTRDDHIIILFESMIKSFKRLLMYTLHVTIIA